MSITDSYLGKIVERADALIASQTEYNSTYIELRRIRDDLEVARAAIKAERETITEQRDNYRREFWKYLDKFIASAIGTKVHKG